VRGLEPAGHEGKQQPVDLCGLQNDEKQSKVISKLALEMGYKRFAILHDRNDFGVGGRDEFSKASTSMEN